MSFFVIQFKTFPLPEPSVYMLNHNESKYANEFLFSTEIPFQMFLQK